MITPNALLCIVVRVSVEINKDINIKLKQTSQNNDFLQLIKTLSFDAFSKVTEKNSITNFYFLSRLFMQKIEKVKHF